MMRAPNGLIVTKMLHNQYIQLLYQVGLIGLILYLAFITQMYVRMKRAYRETADPFYKMTALLGIVVMLGASAYYIAYDFEPFTWLFVGLALAVAQSHEEEKLAMHQYLRAVHAMEHSREPAPSLPQT
jgi:O-antigen ligase